MLLASVVTAAACTATPLEEGGSAPSDTPKASWIDCTTTEAPYECLNDLASSVPLSSEAISDFFVAAGSDALGPGCYDAALNLGRRAWQEFGASSLSLAHPACETGFVHGLLIAGYPAEGESHLISACNAAARAPVSRDLWTESMLLTCVVGTGRAIAQTGLPLRESVRVCSSTMKDLPAPEHVSSRAQSFCVRGAVLDTFGPDHDIADLVDQCLGLPGAYAEPCLTLGARTPASRSVASTEELARSCQAMSGPVRQACFYALSDALANRLYFEKSKVSPAAVRACLAEDDCLWHYAKYLMTATWDANETRRACALLASPAPKQCVNSVEYLEQPLREQGHIRSN